MGFYLLFLHSCCSIHSLPPFAVSQFSSFSLLIQFRMDPNIVIPSSKILFSFIYLFIFARVNRREPLISLFRASLLTMQALYFDSQFAH